MINKRTNVFETNSSSSHSISIASSGTLDTLEMDENATITLNGGQFGWGYDEYCDALTKANYCAVDCHKDSRMEQMLIDVIMEHTGCREVVLNIETDWNSGNWSYIDHQSQGTSHEAFCDKETLKQFIFNPNSWLIIDNDNH